MSDLDRYKEIINHQDASAGEDEFARFLRESAKAKIPEGKGKAAIWDAIEEKIETTEKKKSFQLWPIIGVAATVALVAVFFISTSKETLDPTINYATISAERSSIELPDGSFVEVNANSTLTYSSEWDRRVNLTGEAFFEVTKGSTFEVITPTGKVTVLGTSFNVFARNGELEVACKTGKVQVSIPDKAFTENISPGEAVLFKSDTVKKVSYLPNLIGKWNQGEFYFNEKELTDVIDELQRQFDIDIKVTDSINQKFTGFFTTSDLETALEMVCLPLDLSFEKIGDQNFVIRKNY